VAPRSPAVAVPGEAQARIVGLDGGPSLDARIHVPPNAGRAVVICHPHPLYGGSMHSPVPLAIAKRLSDEVPSGRVAWIRFDFRGVGASEGSYDDGRGEVDDVRAALAHVRRLVPAASITVCGHSFGSFVGYRAAVRDGKVDRLLLIAPSVRFAGFVEEGRRFSGPITIFVGDQDDLCDVSEAQALARQLDADLRVFEGFDHHFLKSRRAVADAALPVIAPEVVPS
jgi:alpha/beta superfamily hydrolase